MINRDNIKNTTFLDEFGGLIEGFYMAHVAKFARGSCGKLMKHYKREVDEEGNHIKYGNADIDTSKSYLNYNLAPGRGSQYKFMEQRLSEIHVFNRADVKTMADWVVTLPKDFPKDHEEDFFKQTYKFLKNKYEEKNIISAYVHRDEITPHLHFSFIPVVFDKKKNREKLSAKELINKLELKNFHPKLEKYLENHFNFKVNILNEATKDGNKNIEELKRGTAKKELDKVIKHTNKIIDDLIPIKAEYNAKKAYIDQSIRDSDISKMYPTYVEVSKRGFIKKQEYVTVPKEQWEKKHIFANHIYAINKERITLEEEINKLKLSTPGKQIKKLKEIINFLEEQFSDQSKQILKLNQIIRTNETDFERINKIFNYDDQIRERFLKLEKELNRSAEQDWDFEI